MYKSLNFHSFSKSGLRFQKFHTSLQNKNNSSSFFTLIKPKPLDSILYFCFFIDHRLLFDTISEQVRKIKMEILICFSLSAIIVFDILFSLSYFLYAYIWVKCIEDLNHFHVTKMKQMKLLLCVEKVFIATERARRKNSHALKQ